MKKTILFLMFAIAICHVDMLAQQKEIPADRKSEAELKESQEKGPSNPLEAQLNATSDGVPRILVGSNNFNQKEGGRLSFDEDGSGTSGICGFELAHDGAQDELLLISGCYIPTGGDTLFVGNRAGNMRFPNRVGIGSMDNPSANLDVEGSVRIVNGTEGAGRVLTSDASGNATWQSSSALAAALTNAGNGTAPTATREFLTNLGTAVTITSSTQTVQWTATQSLGSSVAGGAAGLDIYPGYRIVSGTTPNVIGSGIFNLSCAENTRQLYTISGTVTGLAPGDYYFGMAGDDDGNGNWNNNEWGYVSILVFN